MFPVVRAQAYDAQGRLTHIDSPQGIINYTYDVLGRVQFMWTSHTTIAASAITGKVYTYDVLGRLKTVTLVERNDVSVSEQTQYRYDNAGNLDQVETPGGVIADYDYDPLNRLQVLQTFVDGNDNDALDLGETLLAGYFYTLRDDGKRSIVVEIDSAGVGTIDWFYDELGRLSEERYNGPRPADDFTAEYFFDLASNRVRKEVDTDGDGLADDITDYLYDANDRLTRETFDGQASDSTTFYQYNGTTQTLKTVYDGIHLTDPGGTYVSQTTNTYNVRGRLEEVEIDDDGTVGVDRTHTYQYNDSGIRVSSTDSATGETTIYHIDPNNHTGYAQVLEEGADADGDGRLDVADLHAGPRCDRPSVSDPPRTEPSSNSRRASGCLEMLVRC